MKKKHRVAATQKTELTAKPPQLRPARPWIRHLLAGVALMLMVLVVYSNSFQSGWVLDNQFVIKLDPRNKQATWDNLKLIWQKDYWWPKQDTGAYRPIVSSSYLMNWSVLGNGNHEKESDQVIGFHWVNNVAHGINAFLVYLLVLKLLRRPWAAFFAAALFAVHPIATESVTNIIGRADEFEMTCFLMSTLLYIRSTDAQGLRRLPWLLGVMVFFGAACLSKESAPAFLAVPLLFDGIYRWGSEQYRSRRVKNILSDFLVYMLLTLPMIGVLAVRSVIFRDSLPQRLPFLDNPVTRFNWNDANTLSVNVQNWILARMTACNVATKAFWKLIWPVQLSSDYSYNQIPLFEWQLSNIENIKAVLSVLFIAGTLALAAWCYKRHKAVSFFILFFWIAYGPTSNFLIASSSILGERFLYLPSVAFCALVVLAVDAVAQRFGKSVEIDQDTLKRSKTNVLPQTLVLLILVFYGVRGYNRNFDWRNDVTLGRSALKASPLSFRSYGKLAEAYYQADPISNVDQIIELAEKAVAIIDPLPDNENGTPGYLTLGIYYGFKG